jgi:hypothetical protein
VKRKKRRKGEDEGEGEKRREKREAKKEEMEGIVVVKWFFQRRRVAK